LPEQETKIIVENFGLDATALKTMEKRILANSGCSAKTMKTYFVYGIYLVLGDTK